MNISATGYQHFYEELYRQLRCAGRPTWDAMFDATASYESFWTRPFIDTVLSVIEPSLSGRAALELGCGTGQACCYLARRGFVVCGVDISMTAVELAREAAIAREVAARFVCLDVAQLADAGSPLEPGSFDVILDGNCLHCVVFDAERRSVYRAIRALLKPSGRLLLNTLMRPSKLSYERPLHYEESGILWVERAAANRLAPGAHDKPFETVRIGEHDYMPYRRVHDASALRRELAENGFDVLWEQVRPPRSGGVEPMFQAVAKISSMAPSAAAGVSR